MKLHEINTSMYNVFKNEVEMVTEKVQDTTKVQLNYKDNTEIQCSISLINSVPLNFYESE